MDFFAATIAISFTFRIRTFTTWANKIPCVFPMFWQNFQIPCVFPDRDFLWPFSLFSLCSGYPDVNAWIPIRNLSSLLRSHPHLAPPSIQIQIPAGSSGKFQLRYINCWWWWAGYCQVLAPPPPPTSIPYDDHWQEGTRGQRSGVNVHCLGVSLTQGLTWDWGRGEGGGGGGRGEGGGRGRG